MLNLSVKLTKEEIARIARWEARREYGLTIDNLVKDAKTLRGQVLGLEGQMHKVLTYTALLGAKVPAISVLGPYAVIFALVFQIATEVSKEVTRIEVREERIRREIEIAEIRKEIFGEVIGMRDVEREREKERREAYRGVVPG